MKKSLVLTLIGPDGPGLVEKLSDTIASHGGNWEQSRMAHLAGKFAGILRVSVPSDAAPGLERALAGLEDQGLKIIVETSPEAETPRSGGESLILEVVGNDREGIVRDISSALAARKVNVEELNTEVESAPVSGGRLFKATVRLGLPEGLGVEELREALEAIGDDLMVDISLD